ncbi:DapH/DapD/GlmU-related protein [Flavobacterium sp. ACN6]|uniref:acyltransferase n=1 Tax=Flavobacterium sp. ACN6 TaxID=1920426 RepID=UPI000BB2CE2C|nr:acyltransferase [Flavobacterium sp. ACN6]PBJ08963.1 2,3,4,5-tetrahydropyridine-2,6-dicarboxylate N-acetyltransferase [Flavobacterium sp. ACN6]
MNNTKHPSKVALIYNKISSISYSFSFFLLKIRGLQGGRDSKIESVTCNWPNKLLLGRECEIQKGVDFRIWHPFNDNCYIKLGNKVFIGHACEFVCNEKIIIGNNCLIASKTTINNTGHEYKSNANINTQPTTSEPVILEDDVWIGTSCVILQGVTIGKGSIIAAGSVVNKSIPANEVWAGVPARFIKKRI